MEQQIEMDDRIKGCARACCPEKSTVKPRNNGFEGTKHSCPLLPKSVIANIESKRKKCQGTEAKFAIVRFFTTLGCVIARFYCILFPNLDI